HRMFVERTPGFVVSGLAMTGEEAVEMMHSDPPDVVLLDLQLPGISGGDVLRMLRTHLGDDVDVIVVTADRRASSVAQM
ncbi:response regulator, partial [Pantoea agglomerans]|uniref:response regulator n=1 Tax=Enterobacter agglomerans TaxID=549 RepID=UPI003D2B0371